MTARLVVSDPSIMMGKAVIVGTRITVESILERLAAGESARMHWRCLPPRAKRAASIDLDSW